MNLVVFTVMSYCHLKCFVIGLFMLCCPLCTHPTVFHYILPACFHVALNLSLVNTVYVMHVSCTFHPGETLLHLTVYCPLYMVQMTYLHLPASHRYMITPLLQKNSLYTDSWS